MARITSEKVLLQRVMKMLPKGVPAEAIESVECDPYNGSNGGSYWVYLNAGWRSPDDYCHTIHEDTLDEIRQMVRGIERWEDDPNLEGKSTMNTDENV